MRSAAGLRPALAREADGAFQKLLAGIRGRIWREKMNRKRKSKKLGSEGGDVEV